MRPRHRAAYRAKLCKARQMNEPLVFRARTIESKVVFLELSRVGGSHTYLFQLSWWFQEKARQGNL